MKKRTFPNSEEGAQQMAQYLQGKILKKGIKKYYDDDRHVPTILLAGAPGAGKTEFAKSLLEGHNKYIVLDTDIYRGLFEGYTGDNAHLFQQYASHVMDRMYSFCMKKGLNVIVDGTFSAKRYAEQNILQCIKYRRTCLIVLVYQDPEISYWYTRKRELEKKRSVPESQFIQKYFGSIEVVKYIKEKYPATATFIATKLDKQKSRYTSHLVSSPESIDMYIRHEYTPETLKEAIQEIKDSLHL